MKKLILWTVYVALVGVLIVGAVGRTSATLNDGSEERSANTHDSANTNSEHESGQHGNGLESNNSETHTEQTTEHEWVVLEGVVVVSMTNREMVARMENGQQIEVARRSWRFAQEQGFAPQVGDVLTLTGFYENGEFEAAHLADLTNGQVATLRDENGHPLWAGNGE